MCPKDAPIDVRVVLLTNFVPPYRLPLYEALSARVASLTVLASTAMEQNRSWSPGAGTLDLRVQRSLTIRRAWRHPAGFSEATQVHVPLDTLQRLRRLDPDVVISAELGARTLLAVFHRIMAQHTRLIVWATLSERTERGRGRSREAVRRWILHHADRVLVNGESGARYVRSLGVSDREIDRVPYVALPGFGAAPAHTSAPHSVRRLLFIGQLTERKGLLPFLSALNNWARTNRTEAIRLDIVGSGPLRETLETFRPEGALAISVLGERAPKALPALYAEADILVFPTLADEWGVVVNEALAAGVPILGSIHSQAVEELCEDGETGWTFDPESGESTRIAIERALASSQTELEAMGRRARQRARSLSPEWAAERLVASITEALEASTH